MSPNQRNILVGVVVLGSLGVLAWMILAFAGRVSNFLLTKGTHVRLVAERADGVSDGASVQYLGVNVGRVQSIRLNPNGQGVQMDLIIDAASRVPANVQGVIRTGGLLGGSASISLEPEGPPSSEPIRENTELRAVSGGNSLIPEEFTGLAQDARDRELVRHLDEAIVAIRVQADHVGTLIESVNQLVTDEQMIDDLRGSLASIRTAAEKADRSMSDLETFSGGLSVTTRKLNDRIDQIGTTLEHFEAIAARIDKGDGTLGMLTNDPRLYESLVDTARELNLMVADMKRLVEQWEQEGVSFKLGK